MAHSACLSRLSNQTARSLKASVSSLLFLPSVQDNAQERNLLFVGLLTN